MANAATVNITRPDNGVLRVQGSTSEWTASDFDEFVVTPVGSAMVEKSSRAIILRPQLTMRDMDASHVMFALYFPYLTDPYYTPSYGAPPYREGESSQHASLRTEDASYLYWILGTEELEADQGILVDYSAAEYGGDIKWTDLTLDPVPEENLLFWLQMQGTEARLFVLVYPEKIQVKHRIYLDKNPDGFPVEKEWKETEWEIDIAKNFKLNLGEQESISIIVFFKDEKIHIGINGLDNMVALRAPNTLDGVVMPADALPQFAFRGQAQLAWQPLTFATSADFETPKYKSLYRLNAPTVGVIKSDTPDGTSISISGEVRDIGQDEELESGEAGDIGQDEELERSEYYVTCNLSGDGAHTPSLYRFRMVDPVVRETSGSQTGTLTGDVDEIQLSERLNDTGEYSGGDMALSLTNVPERSLITQNAKINTSVTVEGGTIALNGYYVDVNSITRPAYNMVNLTLHASPISKRLEITPILEAVSYDHLGLTHIGLVQELCDLAGVAVESEEDADSITLPVSPDPDAPNWQFQRGSTIWQALQTVREYSGWLMYPRNNVLQYKKFPAGATTGTALNMDSDAFTDIRYTYADNYRTRFLVIGENEKGQSIFHVGLSDTIEALIGESRPAVIIDPRLSSLDACEDMVSGLMDYYTTQHLYATFVAQRFENYPDLWIGDVIRIVDSKVSIVNNKYFMITALNLNITQFQATAQIEARSLWT